MENEKMLKEDMEDRENVEMKNEHMENEENENLAIDCQQP